MTEEELQEICDKIQTGWKDENCFPTGNRLNRLKMYYNSVIINGKEYAIDLNHKIIIEDVEL